MGAIGVLMLSEILCNEAEKPQQFSSWGSATSPSIRRASITYKVFAHRKLRELREHEM